MNKRIPQTLFNTRLISSSDRMETYRESIGTVFDVTNIDSKGEEFNARMESTLLDEIMLVDTQTVAQNFLITPEKLSRKPLDHILIQIFFEGFTAFRKNGEYHFCDSSTMVVIDSSRPWYAFNPHFRNLTLVVPRRLLKGKLWDFDSHHGRILNPLHNPFAELLETQMLTLYKNMHFIQRDMIRTILEHTVEMAASSLNFAFYAESKRNKKGHTELRKEILRSQFELSFSALADLFSGEGFTSFTQVNQLRNNFKKFSHLTVPEKRYLTGSKYRVMQDLQHTLQNTHRLWEEWILSL